jgi:GAF domain-containing protein
MKIQHRTYFFVLLFFVTSKFILNTMSASATMPYFIRPSINMDRAAKTAAYLAAVEELDALLTGETDPILKMASINSVLKSHLTYYYWVGFYLVRDGRLSVGPYQGTLGCLHIDFERGVCGKAASERKTQLVSDVHALAQGTAHIACDPNSQSEIVVPVIDQQGNLLGVFDVDSSELASFDDIDQQFLEQILQKHF